MTLKFSAHLSTLFTEVPLMQRLEAAARVGFKAVELWSPYEVPAPDFARALADHDLVCVGINVPSGKSAAGGSGLAVDEAHRPEFIDGVKKAMVYAETIGAPNVHVMAGVLTPDIDPAEAWTTYVENIDAACDIAARHGRTVLIEALNPVDRPGYLLRKQSQAIDIIKRLGRSNLKIMLDIYHVQRGEGNLIERLRASLPYAGHMQFADVPGRHEPGTGEINFPVVFAELERLGYNGWIGCEYFPTKSTLESFAWLKPLSADVASRS